MAQYRVTQAAERLGLHRRTVLNLIYRKELPAIPKGGNSDQPGYWLIDETALEEYQRLNAGRQSGARRQDKPVAVPIEECPHCGRTVDEYWEARVNKGPIRAGRRIRPPINERQCPDCYRWMRR